MRIRVSKPDKSLRGTIVLPGSKSVTARALIIKALCEENFELLNYSLSEDSMTLLELLNSEETALDCKDGGTTLRFLTAFLAIHEGDVLLTGSERMRNRPIGPLVDALRQIGCEIHYLEKDGFPPLQIRGKIPTGNRIEVEASMSSQFVSALLLIAPKLPNGLVIKMKGDIVSKPYIELTLQIMKHFGISYEWNQNVISIYNQPYRGNNFRVESDWSAASYYYSMAALCDDVDLKLIGLNRLSFQADSIVAKVMEKFGVTTSYIENGIRLTKNENSLQHFEYDFKQCPDLAQTLLFTCAGLKITAQVSGLNTLKIKETDRVKALMFELARLGAPVKEINHGLNLGISLNLQLLHDLDFETYNDHRMAMSLTPLAIAHKIITINNPEVVRKSYPAFWDDIKELGFQLDVTA